jgi:predicted component of type VI protein secretion system
MAKFLDLDINFDRNPITGDVAVRKDEEAVKRALRNLVLYRKNDKPFHPEICTGITDLLFDNPDPLAINTLKNKLEYMIKKYEPRVKTANVSFSQVVETGSLRVDIDFTITNVNRVFNTRINVERLR